MKPSFVSAVALSFALATAAAAPAYAEQAQFRSAAPQEFSSEDLARYGLNEDQVARAEALQRQGYDVKVLSEEEAQAYTAGITDNQWLLIGILAGVIVIAVAVSD